MGGDLIQIQGDSADRRLAGRVEMSEHRDVQIRSQAAECARVVQDVLMPRPRPCGRDVR
jgi:hypothetical protein